MSIRKRAEEPVMQCVQNMYLQKVMQTALINLVICCRPQFVYYAFKQYDVNVTQLLVNPNPHPGNKRWIQHAVVRGS